MINTKQLKNLLLEREDDMRQPEVELLFSFFTTHRLNMDSLKETEDYEEYGCVTDIYEKLEEIFSEYIVEDCNEKATYIETYDTQVFSCDYRLKNNEGLEFNFFARGVAYSHNHGETFNIEIHKVECIECI